MTPMQFLFLIVATTALAAGLQYSQRQRYVRKLRKLATELQLNYSPSDRFRIAPRVALSLPIPGAAAVIVTDLLYAQEDRGYRYIFRTEYTIGVLRTKTAVRQVGTFCEPRDASAATDIKVLFAPESLPLVDQYRHLYKASRAPGATV